MIAKEQPVKEARTGRVLELIAELERGNLNARGKPSELGDDLDQIMSALNQLADKLSAQKLAHGSTKAQLQTLAQDISKRKRIEEQLSASLQQKEVLLKEIHHRVKNNLQIISSLLYLQSRKITDQAILDMFQDAQNRVKSMALIHEKLYQSEDLACINFAEYVRNLAHYLFRSYRVTRQAISLKISAEEVPLSVEIAIPCGLIINELLSNALKYAFPNGQPGEISLNLQTIEPNYLRLVISDNGIGFPPNINFKKTRSLGLQLVNNLVRQLEGTIELHNHGGTTFKITFPTIRK